MLDRGVIDEEIAEQRILPLLPERLHSAARGLIEKRDDPIVPVEGMLELLQALKAKGYRLYLLSNAATRQPIYWARAEASKLMDGVLISAEVKLLKPDSQIYRTFLHKFALRPEECVFIDDTPSMWRVHSTKTWQASCSTWMFLPLPRACALWAWNGNIQFGEMIMVVWIGLILLICAGFSAYAGASQLEQAKQHAKCSLNAFTLCHSGIQKLLVEGSAGVLESSVTVEQWVSIWIFQNSFIKRIKNQLVVIPVTNNIADNSPVTQIEDRAQIELVDNRAFIPLKLCHIGQPLFIWPSCPELPVQKILCCYLWVGSVFGAALLPELHR